MASSALSHIIEKCKANAARRAVEDNIKASGVVGIGSGSTMRYVLERLKQICNENGLSIKCIPTSFQSKQLILDYGLPVVDLDAYPEIDVAIDGADEVDDNFVAIKGGGACLAQEKVVAFAAKRFIVVADYRKDSKQLGQTWKKGIPIEVLPMACNVVRRHISEKFDANLKDVILRIGKEKAGPVITDNGNFVIDWQFSTDSYSSHSALDWSALSNRLKLIPGVVETGIFAGMVHAAYFGQENDCVVKTNDELQ